jgi:restriction system protein
MVMPKFNELFTDVLKFLSDGEQHDRKEVWKGVTELLSLTDEEKSETIKGGSSRIESRIQWAAESLAQVRAIERPARGTCRITQRGLDLLTANPNGVLMAQIKAFPEYREWEERSRRRRADKVGPNPVVDPVSLVDSSPLELMDAASQLHLSTVSSQLLRRIRDENPEFLEVAVLKLLHAMGYGDTEDDLEHLGGSGDGGVDGLIRQDKLGLDQIYIQAKRYESGTIGRPDIQRFVGALSGKGATRGVFITTSKFSEEARQYVVALPGQKVVLIDGRQLVSLMIQNKVGVEVSRSFELFEINENFFGTD